MTWALICLQAFALIRGSTCNLREALAGVLAAPYTFYQANPSSCVLARLSDDQCRVDEMLAKCKLRGELHSLAHAILLTIARSINMILQLWERWLQAANLPPPALQWSFLLCSLPGLRDSAGYDAVLCYNGHHLLAVSCKLCLLHYPQFSPCLSIFLQFGCSALCPLLLPAGSNRRRSSCICSVSPASSLATDTWRQHSSLHSCCWTGCAARCLPAGLLLPMLLHATCSTPDHAAAAT